MLARPATKGHVGTKGSAEAGASESRFLHLLKPIRDLAMNWNIDVASELEEYLSEVISSAPSRDVFPSHLP